MASKKRKKRKKKKKTSSLERRIQSTRATNSYGERPAKISGERDKEICFLLVNNGLSWKLEAVL